jgi:hypothetical protein
VVTQRKHLLSNVMESPAQIDCAPIRNCHSRIKNLGAKGLPFEPVHQALLSMFASKARSMNP